METTNNQAVATQPSVKTLASTLGVDVNELQKVIVNTIMPQGATNEEVAAFMMVANTYKLNPLLKHIAAFKTKSNGIMPMVMIDGWLNIMHSNPKFDGMEQIDNFNGERDTWAVTTKIYVVGLSKPISVTEYFDECYIAPKEKDGKTEQNVWDKWPKRMLRHKSLIQCIRYALGIGGIYDQDELLRMDSIDAEVVPPANSYLEGPMRIIPTYKEIEDAVKAMGLTLQLSKEYGKDWATAIGKTFENKAELTKLGFITKKDGKGWITKKDVTLNLQEQKQKQEQEQKEPEEMTIETIADLEKYIKGNGFDCECRSQGDKVFAKIILEEDDAMGIAFAESLGFTFREGKGYIRDVTALNRLIA